MRIRKSRKPFSLTLVFRDALKNASLNVVLVGTRWQAPAIVVRTTKNILAFDYGFVGKIILIKKLHLKVQLLSIFTILSASVLSFRDLIH